MKRPHAGKRNLILKSEIDYTRREHVEGILTDESSLTKCANWNPSPSVASLIQAISNSSFSHLMPELFAHNLNKLNRNFVVSSERLRWEKKIHLHTHSQRFSSLQLCSSCFGQLVMKAWGDRPYYAAQTIPFKICVHERYRLTQTFYEIIEQLKEYFPGHGNSAVIFSHSCLRHSHRKSQMWCSRFGEIELEEWDIL